MIDYNRKLSQLCPKIKRSTKIFLTSMIGNSFGLSIQLIIETENTRLGSENEAQKFP